MAKKKDKEARVLADEKVLERISDFFVAHGMKLVLVLLVVLVLAIIWIVSAYTNRSREREVADYLEDALFKASPAANPGAFGQTDENTPLNVNEILKRIEGTKIRPYALWILAQELFDKGGTENLDEAKKVAEMLRDQYTGAAYERYQTLAGEILKKIQEDKEFKIPEPAPPGPSAPEQKPAAETKPAAEGAAPKPAEGTKAAEPKPAEGTSPKPAESQAAPPPAGAPEQKPAAAAPEQNPGPSPAAMPPAGAPEPNPAPAGATPPHP
jgi:hypothetical protein